MPLLPRPRALQGYQAQGNEFSYFMLLASAYLLNGVERPGQVGGRQRGPSKASKVTALPVVRPWLRVLNDREPPPPPYAVDHPPLGAQPVQPAVGGRPVAGRAGAGRAPGRSGARWVPGACCCEGGRLRLPRRGVHVALGSLGCLDLVLLSLAFALPLPCPAQAPACCPCLRATLPRCTAPPSTPPPLTRCVRQEV